MMRDAHRLCLLFAAALSACAQSSGESSTAKAAPATVLHADEDGGAARVVLSPEAETRLDIRTAAVARRSMPRVRSLGAVAELPPDARVVVHAPFGGTLRIPGATIGQTLERGAAVLSILPLLSREREILTPAEQATVERTEADIALARASAEGDLAVAQARVRAADVALARAEELVRQEAGSQRQLADARAEAELARAEVAAAQMRIAALAGLARDPSDEGLQAFTIVAPDTGVLVELLVADGQSVSAGAVLFAVERRDPLWLRVPIYAGDTTSIDREADAAVSALGDRPDGEVLLASPVPAPPSADPKSSSVNLFYALANPGGAIAPGQRLNAKLARTDQAKVLAVPDSWQ